MSSLKLVDVYRTQGAAEFLYELLKERSPKVNISHRKMPTWRQHLNFIRSKPYRAWYLLTDAKQPVGGTYLSKTGEIGIFILKKHRGRGYGKKSVELLMKRHAATERFLANINPANTPSIRFFKKLGFRHIQNTYERRNKE